MDQRTTPLKAVAEALSERTDKISLDEIESSLSGVIKDLMRDAELALQEDEHSDEALISSWKFYVVAELISYFGEVLLAAENIN